MTFERLEVSTSLLELAPDIGGGITRLRLGGRDVLRPTLTSAGNLGPLDLAEFPMAPWVNRVDDGRFKLGAGEICVLSDPEGDPLALHGLAWRSAWFVADRTKTSLSLRMDWSACARWPFAFTMQRRFEIGPGYLQIDANLRNLQSQSMPAALGFHPYFPAAGAVLRARVSGAWATAEGIPTTWSRTTAVDQLAGGANLHELSVDHCFTGWDGHANLAWPTHAISISCSPSPGFLQIYSPLGESFVCVEPQTAMPDALNRSSDLGGLRWLAPGEAMQTSLTISLIEMA